MSTLKAPEEHRPAIKTPQELVHIKHRISLLQYKYWVLMLRAYREAYEEGGKPLADSDYCYLPMSRLAEHLGYEPKTSDIERDLEAIRKEPIIFNVLEKDGKKGKSGRGFVSEWYVSSNRVGVVFPPLIRQAIENLDNRDSIFHLLNWSVEIRSSNRRAFFLGGPKRSGRRRACCSPAFAEWARRFCSTKSNGLQKPMVTVRSS